MKTAVLMLPVLLGIAHCVPGIPEGAVETLADLDREMSALLDAYLEGVPECPAGHDTPLRLWVIDLAWLRAEAVMESISKLDVPEFLAEGRMQYWNDHIRFTEELFEVFSEIQRAFHAPVLPDSSLCVELEDRLLSADSAWRHSGTLLLQMIAEEGDHP